MRGPLDVWLVTETFAPEINGVARTLERWARGLVTRGHRLTVVRPRRRDLPDLNALPWRVHAVPGLPIPMYPALRFGLPRGRALGRLWDAHRPDVV
ncbi:MAG: glycosyltransferase, partial [Acidobacteriota bacterium]